MTFIFHEMATIPHHIVFTNSRNVSLDVRFFSIFPSNCTAREKMEVHVETLSYKRYLIYLYRMCIYIEFSVPPLTFKALHKKKRAQIGPRGTP